ncbi:hypothetical protein GIW60_31055, partial [Pseudomonas gessardii]
MNNPPYLFSSLFLAVGMLIAAPALQAEEIGEVDKHAVTELDTSFVTATGGGTDLRDAPASVS